MSETTPIGVITIPAFNDNYFWLIHNKQYAVVVDPGDAAPVLAALNQFRLQLVAILITHHHADHTAGVLDLLRLCEVPVFGPANPKIAGITHAVKNNDTVQIPLMGLEMLALEVPGHTLDHIAYVATTHGWLFCGDTLFAAGCGRLFEGSPEQMYASLSLLATMPDTTLVFCAHEYTLSNMRFALEVEPDNRILLARQKVDTNKRANNQPTLPSNIGLEKKTNPFLRCNEPSVIKSLIKHGKIKAGSDAVTVFTALREWKNGFR
ncbi:MAG: hydroxyacylglutathione hydrolase [Burkholderiales bacterium]|nr:hydroxyacylglutathione hydrolase [Burkholderiales bacterium]